MYGLHDRPEPIQIDDARAPTAEDDAFHFITYVPHNGCLYELDGLKAGPIFIGISCKKRLSFKLVKMRLGFFYIFHDFFN